MFFENLPVDLIADILGELDLQSLIRVAYVSRRLYIVASDPLLNPWRKPILRNLQSHSYEDVLKHLSVRVIVPRQNWIEILSLARPSFILYEATIPNLKASEWEECFKRRFLPSWQKWRKDCPWKEGFLKVLYRVWHRSMTSCTTDESWTRYIVLNRNGSANELEISSRNFNPGTVFNEMKLQNNLLHLETTVKVIVELADVRILALGILAKPRSNLSVNPSARMFVNPPGISGDTHRHDAPNMESVRKPLTLIDDHGVYPLSQRTIPALLYNEYRNPTISYSRMRYPLPAPNNNYYPFYTEGGNDMRWLGADKIEENGLHWVGSMMITAQLLGHGTRGDDNGIPNRLHFASFGWDDLWAIAPWMDEVITKRIDGPGLGH